MSDCLSWLWGNLDAKEPLYSEKTVRMWPGGGFERLRAMGILREAENATYVECPDCWDAHMEEVISLPDDRGGVRFAIYCPESLRLWIAPEYLRQWAIDCGVLAQTLAETLSLQGRCTDLVPGRLTAQHDPRGWNQQGRVGGGPRFHQSPHPRVRRGILHGASRRREPGHTDGREGRMNGATHQSSDSILRHLDISGGSSA